MGTPVLSTSSPAPSCCIPRIVQLIEIMASFSRITWLPVSLLMVLVVLQVVASAPSAYEDYAEGEPSSISSLKQEKTLSEQPSLYEMLVQRELLMNKINEALNRHSMVRKSGNYPTMRLRFGKRSVPP